MTTKYRIIGAALLLLTLLLPSTVLAQSAVSQTWTSSITYYTPSDSSGTLIVEYYAADGTKYTGPSLNLQPHKAGSLYIGTVSSVPDGFAGSAVLSADVPIVATYVQFASGAESGNYGRIMYNGFDASAANSPFYVPTVLYEKYNTTSRVGVQNVENFDITATLKFYAAGATTPTLTHTVDIPAQSSFIFMPSDVGLPTGFSGSLVIEAVKKGDPSTTGRVVASSEEMAVSGRFAYAFEGVGQGANKVYMPSMQCQYRPEKQMSYYAIQNAGTITATVTITFYNTSGTVVGTMPPTDIPPGSKLSAHPCMYGVPANTYGSAVIASTGAPIIVIGKVSANNGLSTAFVGQPQGATKVALPYIRWAANPYNDFRSYVAIMNVGNADATDIVARYYDGNGNLVATHTIADAGNPLPPFIKRNTDPYTAGALNATYHDFGFHPLGGAVEITSDQPIVVVVRNQKNVSLGATTTFGEDYNGVPTP